MSKLSLKVLGLAFAALQMTVVIGGVIEPLDRRDPQWFTTQYPTTGEDAGATTCYTWDPPTATDGGTMTDPVPTPPPSPTITDTVSWPPTDTVTYTDLPTMSCWTTSIVTTPTPGPPIVNPFAVPMRRLLLTDSILSKGNAEESAILVPPTVHFRRIAPRCRIIIGVANPKKSPRRPSSALKMYSMYIEEFWTRHNQRQRNLVQTSGSSLHPWHRPRDRDYSKRLSEIWPTMSKLIMETNSNPCKLIENLTEVQPFDCSNAVSPSIMRAVFQSDLPFDVMSPFFPAFSVYLDKVVLVALSAVAFGQSPPPPPPPAATQTGTSVNPTGTCWYSTYVTTTARTVTATMTLCS